MNVSTAHSTRPAPTHTVTLLDTSNSDTIHDVGIQDSTTGPHTRSTTSTWNGGSPRELTVKELSGKRGAHQLNPVRVDVRRDGRRLEPDRAAHLHVLDPPFGHEAPHEAQACAQSRGHVLARVVGATASLRRRGAGAGVPAARGRDRRGGRVPTRGS